jgi:UDP-N-acetylmuramoyl-tripeptide--D-alanyl-D-alanine ligase
MRFTVAELASRLGGRLQGADENAAVTGFATDNRQVRPGDLFIAIKGANVDGHAFVDQATSAGAVAVLVEDSTLLSGNRSCIVVENVVDALATLGRSFRNQFDGPVIGITGSAGKTTTKEFTVSALSTLGRVIRTEGNRNTEYTSPLAWAEQWDSEDAPARTAVIEMGMRGFGQIAHLASISQPTIAIITNIGWSHLELVGSREGIAQAKSEILEELRDDGTAVLWAEDEYLGTLINAAGDRKIVTFGRSGNADCQITDYRPLDWYRAEISGVLKGKKWKTVMPTVGRHLALNVAAALLAATEAGADLEAAALAIQETQLPPMRMEIRSWKGGTLVMDNYNSNPPAVEFALETLADVPVEGRRIVVLGTMRELGEESAAGHRAVGRAVARFKPDRVVLIGPDTGKIAEGAVARGYAGENIVRAEAVADLASAIGEIQPGDAILVKGSRALALERGFPE